MAHALSCRSHGMFSIHSDGIKVMSTWTNSLANNGIHLRQTSTGRNNFWDSFQISVNHVFLTANCVFLGLAREQLSATLDGVISNLSNLERVYSFDIFLKLLRYFGFDCRAKYLFFAWQGP